ncbi:HNH endonuclease signature motif containing protein, partial [Mycolicibacterium stellerae]|uniref:HNH endonuclease signature motif containing protein n=1 Tax=Mycolicibacterium stellerae TaxID=2358193 RepID=UPI0019D31D9C
AAEQPAQPDATADATAAASQQPPRSPGLLVGHGVLPNALLAEAIRSGATITPIRMPGGAPEPRYRPSAELAEFVRMRDLFCRFPGCTVAADRCDIDHVRPWPWGPTHASNLNCKCRRHHLMKTFWTGIGGWADQQLPDGTVIWTAPSGKTFTTQPGSRLFFPTWNVTTAELPPATKPPPNAEHRGLMMPRRQRT